MLADILLLARVREDQADSGIEIMVLVALEMMQDLQRTFLKMRLLEGFIQQARDTEAGWFQNARLFNHTCYVLASSCTVQAFGKTEFE